MNDLAALAALVTYDRETGRFIGRDGRSVERAHNKGYVRVRIGGMDVLAHRLAWFIIHGEIPPAIDHINRLKADNRPENLRKATPSQNQCNRGPQKNCASGVPGVFWYARKGKWMAHIKRDNKRRHLGYFETKEAAVAARKAAEPVIFGEFAPA